MASVPRSYWDERARTIAEEEGVDPDLFSRVVKAESGFNPNARSKAGAIGLSQLMEKTAKGLGVNRYNPDENLRGGARYLRQQLDEFKTPELALAAYNAGPTRVRKAGGIPMIRETMDYIDKIIGKATKPRPTGAVDMNNYPSSVDIIRGVPMNIGSTQGNTNFDLGFNPKGIGANAPRFVDPNIPQSSWQQTAGKGEGIPPRPTITPNMPWPKPAGAGIGVGGAAAATGGGLALPLLAAAAGVGAAGYQGYKAATGQKPIGEDFVLNAIKDWAPHAGLEPDYPYTDNEGAPVSSAIPSATRNKPELDTANMQGVEPAWVQSHEPAPEQEPAKPAFVEGPNIIPERRGLIEGPLPRAAVSGTTGNYLPGLENEFRNPAPTIAPDVLRIGENGLVPVRTANRKYAGPNEPDLIPIPAGGVEVIRGNERTMMNPDGTSKLVGESYPGQYQAQRKEDFANQIFKAAMEMPDSYTNKKPIFDKSGEWIGAEETTTPNNARMGMFGAAGTVMGGVDDLQKGMNYADAIRDRAEIGKKENTNAEKARLAAYSKAYQENEEALVSVDTPPDRIPALRQRQKELERLMNGGQPQETQKRPAPEPLDKGIEKFLKYNKGATREDAIKFLQDNYMY